MTGPDDRARPDETDELSPVPDARPRPEPEGPDVPDRTADLLPIAPVAGVVAPAAGAVMAQLVGDALPDEDGLDAERADL
jgi:hypothetical protein